MSNLISIINHKWTHLCLYPIHVYCLHHVSKQYIPEAMYKEDWIPLEVFQKKIISMMHEGIRFISMSLAYHKIRYDQFRWKNFAVLAFDDGYASLKEVLPWLREQGIPVALFVNPDYAKGKAYRESEMESYLSMEELSDAGVEIGMHGVQHLDVNVMEETEFREFVDESIKVTSSIRGYVPFWAYTWGRHNEKTDSYLRHQGVVPVLIDGMKNYNDATCIHRELLIC